MPARRRAPPRAAQPLKVSKGGLTGCPASSQAAAAPHTPHVRRIQRAGAAPAAFSCRVGSLGVALEQKLRTQLPTLPAVPTNE